jgi:hypothetical protein
MMVASSPSGTAASGGVGVSVALVTDGSVEGTCLTARPTTTCSGCWGVQPAQEFLRVHDCHHFGDFQTLEPLFPDADVL